MTRDLPYNDFNSHLRRVFGARTHRVPIDAGFTCPVRDGKISSGGCWYCSTEGSAAAIAPTKGTVAEQIASGIRFARRRYEAEKFIAYFQAFTGTYAPAGKLRELSGSALAAPGIEGLIVGTRPDCIDDETYQLLSEYAKSTYFWLELGLQSSNDETLKRINRGHDLAAFAAAVRRAAELGIRTAAHVIIGLPGESRETILKTISDVNALPVGGLKIHSFHVLKGSEAEADYRAGKFKTLEKGEYISLAADALERLRPETIIMRLTGEAPEGMLVAPEWVRDKNGVLAGIKELLERRGSRQGTLFGK